MRRGLDEHASDCGQGRAGRGPIDCGRRLLRRPPFRSRHFPRIAFCTPRWALRSQGTREFPPRVVQAIAAMPFSVTGTTSQLWARDAPQPVAWW